MIRLDSVTDETGLELLRRALTALTLRVPLVGFSFLGETLEIVESDAYASGTMATDGRRVWYSPSFVKARPTGELAFVLHHEWMHVFCNHVKRRGDRHHYVWNVACDMVVNYQTRTVFEEATGTKWEIPKDMVQVPEWSHGLSAEEIYTRLAGDPEAAAKNHPGSGDFQYELAETHPEAEEDTFFHNFVAELTAAKAVMEQTNTKTTDFIAKRLAELTGPRVRWDILLRGNTVSDMGRDHTTFAPPNRKYFPDIILPSMRSYEERILLIGVDVSASVGDKLLNAFANNIGPAAARARETVIVTFDEILRERIKTRRPKDVLKQLSLQYGYHRRTSALEVFEVADEVKPSSIVVLTDGYVEIPDRPYPKTHWVIPIGGRPQPWGKNYVMEISW